MDLGLVIPELEESYQKVGFYRKLEILQKAEVQKIEIHASFLLDKKEKKLLELKKELEESGISVYSVHAPFGQKNDLSNPYFKIRKRTISQHIAVMKSMDIAKIPILTIHPGGRVEKEEDMPLREELFKKSLERLLKEAENLKIKLAIENMLPMHPGYKTETIKQIIDKFSSSFLGVCFDTGHANVGEGVNEEFQIIKEKVLDFHIHDNDGTQDTHLQPPYGNINWAEFFTAVENTAYKGPLMIESFPWQGREISWMMREVRMLKDNKILMKKSPQALNRDYSGSGQEHFLRCKECGHFIYGTESNPICYCNLKNSYGR